MIARRRPLVIGIALLLGVLSGCATGQVSQTASQAAAVNGANGQAGSIAVRDAEFVYPEGGEHRYPSGSSVALKMTIVNSGGTKDRLVAVRSPQAGSTRLEGATTIPARSSVQAVVHAAEPPEGATSAPITSSATALPPGSSTTVSPASPPSATSSTSATSPPSPTSGESLPPGELTITLEKLVEDIKPGRTVEVVLVFEQAGEIKLAVPVAAPDEPRGESGY